jgi:hypothetical protein
LPAIDETLTGSALFGLKHTQSGAHPTHSGHITSSIDTVSTNLVTQRERLVLAILGSVVFLATSGLVTGIWAPKFEPASLWFWAGTVTTLLPLALQESLFSTPADAFVTGIGTIVALAVARQLEGTGGSPV